MKSKKIIAIIMVMFLMVSLFGAVSISAATKTKLNKSQVTLKIGQSVTLKVLKNKKKVKWSSKNKKVATVSKKGKVVAKKIGSTTIVAKVGKKSYKCKVKVTSNEQTTTAPESTVQPTIAPTEAQTTKKDEITKPVETTTADPNLAIFKFRETTSTVIITGYKGSSSNMYIPDQINGKPVTRIDEKAFWESDEEGHKLTNVSIPASVISIANLAFSNCASLKIVEFRGDGLKSIGNNAFALCKNLTEFNTPKTVQQIGDFAFLSCISLKKIALPKTVNTIGTSPFSACSSLEEIVFEDGIIALPNLSYNSSIKTLTVPASIGTIPEDFFAGMKGLTTVVICDGITSIGEYAFWDDSSLETITIPASVTEIGEGAFEDSGLSKIITTSGSYAEQYAKDNGIEIEIIE